MSIKIFNKTENQNIHSESSNSSFPYVSKLLNLANRFFQSKSSSTPNKISLHRKSYPITKTGFPNLFFTDSPEAREKLINNLENAITSILPKIRIPHLTKDKTFKFTGFFDEIETLIRKQDPEAIVYLGGGSIRSILSFIYKELYEAYNNDQDPQELLAQICQGSAKFSVQKEDGTISAMDILGIESDIDIYVQFSEKSSNQQAALDDAKKFINEGIQILSDSPYKALLCPSADIKEYQPQLQRASRNGGSPIDWLVFPLTSLSGSKFKVPDSCKDVLENFCSGTLTYKPIDNAEDPSVTTLRMYRSLFELPFLELNEDDNLRFVKDLQVISSETLYNTSQKVKQVFEKILCNTRFPDRLNFEVKNKATEASVLERQKALTNISRKYMLNKGIPALPELVPSNINTTEIDLELLDIFNKQNLFIPTQRFINRYTDNGILYHGTPEKKNAIPMIRGNLIISTTDQGFAGYGRGFYSTKDLYVAERYAGSQGQVLSFTVRQKNLRVINLDTLPQDVLDRLQTKSKEKGLDIHEYLATYLKIDIVINTHILILNNHSISLKASQEAFLKEAILEKSLNAIEFFKNFNSTQIADYNTEELIKKLQNTSTIPILKGLLSENEIKLLNSDMENALKNALETAKSIAKITSTTRINVSNFIIILSQFPIIKDIKDIILEAVTQVGELLEDASDRLKDDKNIVLAAVKQEGWALRHASDRLKDDKDVVLEAVKQNGWALKFASDRLKNDKDVFLEAMKEDMFVLINASDQLKNDKDVGLTIVKQYGGWALKFLSDRLRNDKDVVLAAYKNNKKSLKFTTFFKRFTIPIYYRLEQVYNYLTTFFKKSFP